MKRAAGVLMPVFSLPSKYGIGCFDGAAYEFVDWLVEAGQTYWQILPLGPTAYGDSPYQAYSTFAGNPYFISLTELIKEGVLSAEECDNADWGNDPAKVDYEKQATTKMALLRKAYQNSKIAENEEFRNFVNENHWWLNDYALFMAVKARFGGKNWTEWAEDIKLRYSYAMMYYNEQLYFDIEFQKYVQFKFFQQWNNLKKYANDKGIKIVGDIPIYVSADSSDVWANPQLFQLDMNNKPYAVAGCPPDAFSATGQLWGNPLYRWDYHEQTGYQWWMTRLWASYQMYDVVRIDHFRGFDEYYSIPATDDTALNGHWEQGPGMKLFNRMNEYLGKKEVIAEDLGTLTESVVKLVKDSGFPGMKILGFAFYADDLYGSAYMPHNIEKNSVVYTGTHDNETITGWAKGLKEEDLQLVRDYLCDYTTPVEKLYMPMAAMALRTCADTCIIPLQDYIGLDNSARVNVPGTAQGNWGWRLLEGQIPKDLAKQVYAMTKAFKRLSESAFAKELKAQEESRKEAK